MLPMIPDLPSLSKHKKGEKLRADFSDKRGFLKIIFPRLEFLFRQPPAIENRPLIPVFK